MTRVLVSSSPFQDLSRDYFDGLRQAGMELIQPDRFDFENDPEALVNLLQGVDAVIASTEPYTRDVLSRAKLRVISRTGVGYDSIDVEAATEHGVVVTTTPGAVDVAVAEHTIALILAVYRGLAIREREVRAGKWTRAPLPRLSGKTLGLVGMGRIGKEVVMRALGLQMRVIAHDPYPDEQFAAKHGVRLCSLDELLGVADVVSLHLPCTAETTDIIDAEAIAKMKPNAVLVNTGRGGLVDEAALYNMLASGHLFAAALDVFKQEPLPADSPLLKLDNVIVTTHTAGLDEQSMNDVPRMAARNVVDLYEGRWPEPSVINRQLRNGWKW